MNNESYPPGTSSKRRRPARCATTAIRDGEFQRADPAESRRWLPRNGEQVHPPNLNPFPPVNRLPGYDHQTQRLELAAFLGLGLVAVWLAGTAGRQAGAFAVERDHIAAILSGEAAGAVCDRSATNHALTNLTAIPPPEVQREPGRVRLRAS